MSVQLSGEGVPHPRSVGGGGYPVPGLDGGGGGTPSQGWMVGGVPHPRAGWWGYPIPGLDGGGYPGYPPARSGW